MRSLLVPLGVVALTLPVFGGGPPNAEDIGLTPDGFGIEATAAEKQTLRAREAGILKAIFVLKQPKGFIAEPSGATGWYDEDRNLCQIRTGGRIRERDFWASAKKSDWTRVPTPHWYLAALHASPDRVATYEGTLDSHPAHLVWLTDAFMVVVELRKPNQVAKPTAPSGRGSP